MLSFVLYMEDIWNWIKKQIRENRLEFQLSFSDLISTRVSFFFSTFQMIVQVLLNAFAMALMNLVCCALKWLVFLLYRHLSGLQSRMREIGQKKPFSKLFGIKLQTGLHIAISLWSHYIFNANSNCVPGTMKTIF